MNKKIVILTCFSFISLVGYAQRPTTSAAVVRPTTRVSVSRPQTVPGTTTFRPTTPETVIQPMTTVEVTHPTTPATPENANVALVQPTKVMAPNPVTGGSSKNAKTSMSGYKPPQAKDFKAASTAQTGGLSQTPEKAPSNPLADFARKQQQDLVSGGIDKAAPKGAGDVSSSSISKAVSQEVSKHSKK